MKQKSPDLRKVNIEAPVSISVRSYHVPILHSRYHSFHWHDCFEVELVLSGSAIHSFNKEVYKVKKGSMYLLTPADIHTFAPDPDDPNPSLEVFNIRFNDPLLSQPPFLDVISQANSLAIELDEKKFADFYSVARALMQTAKTRMVHTNDALHHLLLSFLLMFVDEYQTQKSEKDHTDPRSSHNNDEHIYIRKAMAYIKYNFRDSNISVPSIAREVCLSQNYFGILFKKHIGMSCLSYIKQTRLDFASSMLQNSSLTVSEIAQKSGYTNISRFISDFRNAYGIPPQKYRIAKKAGSDAKPDIEPDTD